MLLGLLRVYLEVFVVLAANRRHARQEHGLLLGSIHYLYEATVAAGTSTHRAFLVSVWNHLGEIQPFALYAKTNADAELDGKPLVATPFRRLSRALALTLAITVVGASIMVFMMLLFLWPHRDER